MQETIQEQRQAIEESTIPLMSNDVADVLQATDYGKCRCGRPAIGEHGICAEHLIVLVLPFIGFVFSSGVI